MKEDSPTCRYQGRGSNDLDSRYNKLNFANYQDLLFTKFFFFFMKSCDKLHDFIADMAFMVPKNK
jgi:hypothetical protein